VGGGPAGLMAAEVLATEGLQVAVYEHMPSVGRKLLLAGRSGLNLTHGEPLDELVARYGEATSIGDAVRAFPPAALRAWCAGLGEATYVGSSGRVFPASFRATPLLRAWLARLNELGVMINPRHRWLGWGTTPDGLIDPGHHRFRTATVSTIDVRSDITVFALGGASWPRVGSDGGWVAPFSAAGVHVRTLRPTNCGVCIAWTSRFSEQFAGAPLKNVALGVGGVSVRGDVTVTREGIESGPVYTHSATIRDCIERDGMCSITVDLHPDLTVPAVQQRLALRRPKDSTATALRRALGLSPASIALLREATANQVPTDAAALAILVKAVPLSVHSTMPLDRAISTAGGLALDELDDRFMVRRLPGTFVAGEMLDWEAPTGGYLLQASFSTAVAAGNGAIEWLRQASE
jgi:uncharacterized flavoprotein (TIGR03862 family)